GARLMQSSSALASSLIRSAKSWRNWTNESFDTCSCVRMNDCISVDRNLSSTARSCSRNSDEFTMISLLGRRQHPLHITEEGPNRRVVSRFIVQILECNAKRMNCLNRCVE